MLVGVLDKSVNVRRARLEGGVGVLESLVQVDRNNVGDLDVRRVPATVVHTTVQPVDVAVGTTRSGDVLCK